MARQGDSTKRQPKEIPAGDDYIHGILYPTDYTVSSLGGLRKYLEQYKGGAVRIVLVHGYAAPDSISDLLFYSPSLMARALAGEDFIEACNALKNRFAFVATVGHTVFSGKTQSAFDIFVKAYGIREAILVGGYAPRRRDKASFGLDGYIRDSVLKVSQIDIPEIAAFADLMESRL